MPKTPKKSSKEAPSVPRSQVIRMADRLHRLGPERREGAVARAAARLKGKHPSRRDAAVETAAGTV